LILRSELGPIAPVVLMQVIEEHPIRSIAWILIAVVRDLAIDLNVVWQEVAAVDW
jgi:hypothetical protein